jgi:hypothetical protein
MLGVFVLGSVVRSPFSHVFHVHFSLINFSY